MLDIDLRGDGRRIVIPVLVLRPQPTDLTSVAASALLDTGATTSGISTALAEALSLRPMGKRILGTAGGEVQVEQYVFRFGFDAGGTGPATLPYASEPLSGFQITSGHRFDALIGMDLIAMCHLELMPGGRGRLRLP